MAPSREPKRRAASGGRPSPALAGSDTGVLPLDAVYEILLRLPAKVLCRLRAVCRLWRSLLSDSHFMDAHAARHPGPLITVGCPSWNLTSKNLFYIMDLSGDIVKRVQKTVEETNEMWVVRTQLDLVCVEMRRMGCQPINPATGTVYLLPKVFEEEHDVAYVKSYRASVSVGKIDARPGYKVLRILDLVSVDSATHLCEVFTLDGTSHALRGRKKAPPPVRLDLLKSVVINNIAYFFLDDSIKVDNQDTKPDSIASFDLETEEWRTILQGPLSSLVDNVVGVHNHRAYRGLISIAALNGCLVVVHETQSSSVNLWFLMDTKMGLWVKRHSIQVDSSIWKIEYFICPLLVLNDGNIVIYIASTGVLRIYNSRTTTSTDVAEIGWNHEIGLYTGNLLNLANGAS